MKSFSQDELEEWQQYYDRLDVGPYHSPAYLDFIAGRLERETRAELVIVESDNEFVYYPYLIRPLSSLEYADEVDLDLTQFADIISSWYYGGPIPSDEGSGIRGRFANQFSEYCRKEGFIAEFIRFDPNEQNHTEFPNLEPTFNRETVWVDLTQSEAAIWDGFETRNRNAIRQARDARITIESSWSWNDVEAFHTINSNAMEAKGASEQYRFSLTFFRDLLEDSNLSSFLVARYENDVIGGSVIVHDEKVAHDYLRASNPHYWDKRVNNLLCYEAILHMRESDRVRFDFQGGRPGVFKFKKSFSPNRGDFYVAKRIHDQEKYDRLVNTAKRNGVDTTTEYFPNYRIEQSN